MIPKNRHLEIALDPKILDNYVIKDIHPKDGMFVGDERHYFSCGRDAIKKILGIMILNDVESPAAVLDFACGFGRVARYLRAAFPNSHLTVSDLMTEAVDFCASTFSAAQHYSIKDFKNIDIQQKQDLIWSGSLLTHLDENKSKELLDFFSRHLQPGGLAIFTSHGRYVAKRAYQVKWPYNLDQEIFLELSRKFDSGKFAYSDYDHMKGYGISITPPRWLFEHLAMDPSIRLVSYIERGWDNHQDVVAIQKQDII